MKPLKRTIEISVVLVLFLAVSGCDSEEEKITIPELEERISGALVPGAPLADVQSFIEAEGLSSLGPLRKDCTEVAKEDVCGRILRAVFPEARKSLVCITDILIVFRFDESERMEDYALGEQYICV